MGLYYDDVEIGWKMDTAARTITEADIVMFGSLTGDFNDLHFNEEKMKNSVFGSRIAHAMLGLSYCCGLCVQTRAFEGTTIAFLEIADWKIQAAIRIGDTLHATMIIEDKIPSKSKPDRGIIVRRIQLINQNGLVVQEGINKLMVKRKN